jgi:hypothetical protein
MEPRTRTAAALLALSLLPAAAAADEPFAAPAFNPWAAVEAPGRDPCQLRGAAAGDFGSLTSTSTVREVDFASAWEDPLARREWKTDQAWNCPVAGPLFAFGQLGANATEAETDTKAAVKTGVGCKWAPARGAELVVRGGPSVTYTDPLRPDHVQEKSEWLLEVQARWPLLASVGLEYQGTAAPALTPLEHDRLTNDVRLAVPVGSGGKFRVGAKCRWDDGPETKPPPDAMQLYLGLELKH